MEYIPYVYIVKNKTTKLKYLGVRYAIGCNPIDLWNTYFTSSTLVKKLIDEFGVDDWYIKVIHKYKNDPESAIKREANYFPLIQKRDDYLNCCFSSGIQDLRVASNGGKIGGHIVKARKIGIFRADKWWCSKAGKIGGKKQAELGLGFHKYKTDPKLHKQWSSKGGQKACEINGWKDPIQQSKKGKKGGVKNKNSVWYNDGKNEFKFTENMQKKCTFDKFIKRNENFFPGRITTQKNKMWVNDGEKNYMINKEKFDSQKFQIGRLGDKSKYGYKNKKN